MELDNYKKIQKTILSCKSMVQLTNTRNWIIDLFSHVELVSDMKYGRLASRKGYFYSGIKLTMLYLCEIQKEKIKNEI